MRFMIPLAAREQAFLSRTCTCTSTYRTLERMGKHGGREPGLRRGWSGCIEKQAPRQLRLVWRIPREQIHTVSLVIGIFVIGPQPERLMKNGFMMRDCLFQVIINIEAAQIQHRAHGTKLAQLVH